MSATLGLLPVMAMCAALMAGCSGQVTTPDTTSPSEPKSASSAPAEAVMPDLIGLPYLEGQELLGAAKDAAHNRTVIQARTRVTHTAKPGTYVGQSPAAGTALTPTTVIRIFVEAARPEGSV